MANIFGAGWWAALAPANNPRLAANIMSLPPAAWTVVNATPNRPNCHAAFSTVLGMSCSFKSKNMSTG